MWLECEKQSSDEDPFICCISFIKLPKGSSSSLANLVVSQTWQKLRQAWRGLTTQAHIPQKSCLIAAGLKHGPKQVVYRDVDTQSDGNVQAPKRWDLVWEGHRWKNVLRSFALHWLWKKNACPLAAMLITLLWRASTHCPLSCPKGEPAAAWFLPALVLCQLSSLSSPPGQENQPDFSTLIRGRTSCHHLWQSGSFALGCMESRTSLWLCGTSALESASIQCRTLITRQGWGVTD